MRVPTAQTRGRRRDDRVALRLRVRLTVARREGTRAGLGYLQGQARGAGRQDKKTRRDTKTRRAEASRGRRRREERFFRREFFRRLRRLRRRRRRDFHGTDLLQVPVVSRRAERLSSHLDLPPGHVPEQSAPRVGRRANASAQRQDGFGDLRVSRVRRRRRGDVPGELARAGHRRGRARGRFCSRAQREAGRFRRRLRARRQSKTGARRILHNGPGRAFARRRRRQRHGFGVELREEASADAGGGSARRRLRFLLLLPRVSRPDDLGRGQRVEALDLRQPRRERSSVTFPRRPLGAAEARCVLRRGRHASVERGGGRPRVACLLRHPGPAIAGAVAVARRAQSEAPENRREGIETAADFVHGVERDARARLGERRDMPRGRASRVHVAFERRRLGRARPRASRESRAGRRRRQQEPGDGGGGFGVRELCRRRRRQRRRPPIQLTIRPTPRRV